MPRGKRSTPDHWRNSIVRYADEDPTQLLANPANWRVHPKEQTTALRGSLNEVGWIAPVIVNETTQHVVDGHARIGEAIARGESTVPVAYVQLTEEQERLALATFDPISAMAGTDRNQLEELLDGLQTGDEAVDNLLNQLRVSAGVEPANDPNAEWQDMPQFDQDDLRPAKQLIVSFANMDDVEEFASLLGRKITSETKSLWYPEREPHDMGQAYSTGDAT